MADPSKKQRANALPAQPVNVWELLRSIIEPTPTVRPENSVTPQEVADKLGCSETSARKKMKRAEKAGVLRVIAVSDGKGGKYHVYVPNEGATVT